MIRIAPHLLILAFGGAFLVASPQDADVVFHSDVSLVRIDAQVVDSSNRSITHLNDEDFVLHANGQVVPIRNFASEKTWNPPESVRMGPSQPIKECNPPSRETTS